MPKSLSVSFSCISQPNKRYLFLQLSPWKWESFIMKDFSLNCLDLFCWCCFFAVIFTHLRDSHTVTLNALQAYIPYIIMRPQKELQKAVRCNCCILLYPRYLPPACISIWRLNYRAKWIYIDFTVVTTHANMYTWRILIKLQIIYIFKGC